MSEWPKEHAWKACVRLAVPRVRIPPSPPFFISPEGEIKNGEISPISSVSPSFAWRTRRMRRIRCERSEKQKGAAQLPSIAAGCKSEGITTRPIAIRIARWRFWAGRGHVLWRNRFRLTAESGCRFASATVASAARIAHLATHDETIPTSPNLILCTKTNRTNKMFIVLLINQKDYGNL